MAIPLLTRRITVDEYEQMIADGLLTEDDRVELIAGEIVKMAAMGRRHVNAVHALSDTLRVTAPLDVTISVQCPIRLEDSEPEPDIALLRRMADRPTVPLPADVFVVIEVADSSIEDDRWRKFPRYAAADIGEAWLVDIKAGTLERHTEPHRGRYGLVVVARRGESLPSVVFPSVVFDVDTILGAAPTGG